MSCLPLQQLMSAYGRGQHPGQKTTAGRWAAGFDPLKTELINFVVGTDYRKSTERSEEHTSELQSLMRISYAVFCLKKKKNTQTKHKIPRENMKTTRKQTK